MNADTVDILVTKGHFDPNVAIAMAEAMDVATGKGSAESKTDFSMALNRAKSDILCQIYKALYWHAFILVICGFFLVGIAKHL